jgi:glycosyltransferase involved in cell wall biosynthesis
MQNSPFFSVIVPTYNQAKYLGEALDSLLAQTEPDWEALVVNDGSTDSTPEVLEPYFKKDRRFRVIHKENGGVASALNAGLRQAKGEWICWLSSDDLFETRKLEIHREWIVKHPACRFFFSHFRELDEATGKFSDPPLWRPIPDREWQVLEMLRCTYVHGNSICVQGEAWTKAGMFNEELRFGQDYDMWLRLLGLYPAVFIPERTCITRRHPSQGYYSFPQAGFFDSAKAAIAFLNRYSFTKLVPFANLSDPRTARKALLQALSVAADPSGFLYALGPHPALLLRIMEWAWRDHNRRIANTMQRIIRGWTKKVSFQHKGTAFGFYWKAAAVASQLPERRFDYQPISPAMVAEAHYWLLKSVSRIEAEPLHRYLEMFEKRSLPKDAPAPHGKSKEVVFVCQKGTHLTGAIKYGTFRATIEVAKYLIRAGRMVLLTGLSDQGMGFIDGVLFVGAHDNRSWAKAVTLLGPIDTLIGISRTDIFRLVYAQRLLVYHHDPHPVWGMPVQVLNKAKVPVICPSQHSQTTQIAYGLRNDLVHLIPNAYDPLTFYVRGGQRRPVHSLVYAGHVVPYKGLDIALQAFVFIKNKFPDAVFHVYGGTCSWGGFTQHLFAPGWLDSDGYPAWPEIERELPGFQYWGEVSQAELADALRQYSLLIMPSRIPETFSIVSLEAQACGCIPVLPRQGGFPETMREGRTGYLYNENTPECLATKILELWKHGLPTETQRSEAQKWVQDIFWWEKSASALLDIIEPMPIRTWRRPVVFHVLGRWEQAKCRPRRIVNLLGGQPMTQWAGLIKGLWAERQQRRQQAKDLK